VVIGFSFAFYNHAAATRSTRPRCRFFETSAVGFGEAESGSEQRDRLAARCRAYPALEDADAAGAHPR
jgi:hypothetical protein